MGKLQGGMNHAYFIQISIYICIYIYIYSISSTLYSNWNKTGIYERLNTDLLGEWKDSLDYLRWE